MDMESTELISLQNSGVAAGRPLAEVFAIDEVKLAIFCSA
jgi:hypothetical protein